MFELHLECDFSIDIENHEKIWELLTPIQLEVSAEGYLKSEKDKSIAILILFSSKLEQDFLPAIETKQGLFHQVLSGT